MFARIFTPIKTVVMRTKQHVTQMDPHEREVLVAISVGSCFCGGASYAVDSQGNSVDASVLAGVLFGAVGTFAGLAISCFPPIALVCISLAGGTILGRRSYQSKKVKK